MKKQYVNPQCEYWCYISGQLCSVAEVVYGNPPQPGDGGKGSAMNPVSGTK